MKPVIRFIIIGLVLVGGLLAVQIIEFPLLKHQNKEYNLNLLLTFKQREFLVDGKTSIEFSDVIDDSRCPNDVVCIWSGRILIEIKLVDENGLSEYYNLSSVDTVDCGVVHNTDCEQKSISYNNYTIELIDVRPYPSSNTNITKSEYVAEFNILFSQN